MALFMLAAAAALNPAVARVFGYLLDVTEAADPTPALAAALFGLAGRPSRGPDSALVRWLLAEPVRTGATPSRARPAGGPMRCCCPRCRRAAERDDATMHTRRLGG